jgi:hypothetical protein
MEHGQGPTSRLSKSSGRWVYKRRRRQRTITTRLILRACKAGYLGGWRKGVQRARLVRSVSFLHGCRWGKVGDSMRANTAVNCKRKVERKEERKGSGRRGGMGWDGTITGFTDRQPASTAQHQRYCLDLSAFGGGRRIYDYTGHVPDGPT